MYDFKAKAANVMKSKKVVRDKTKFFNLKTKELMKEGKTRQAARQGLKRGTNPSGQIGASPFAKSNLRQTRRDRSARLKVPFRPQYNGPVFKQIWIENEKGKLVSQLIAI